MKIVHSALVGYSTPASLNLLRNENTLVLDDKLKKIVKKIYLLYTLILHLHFKVSTQMQ